MFLADRPTAAGHVDIDAPRGVVWSLLTDPQRMGDFSPENDGGSWDPPATGPAVGATFTSSNTRKGMAFVRTSTVLECEEPRLFSFAAGDRDDATAIWRYELHPRRGDGTRVVEHMVFGTAPSPLTEAIAAAPEDEEVIVAARTAEHLRNIAATLTALKVAAEELAANTS